MVVMLGLMATAVYNTHKPAHVDEGVVAHLRPRSRPPPRDGRPPLAPKKVRPHISLRANKSARA